VSREWKPCGDGSVGDHAQALIVLLATSWLEDLGYEVETAFNGSEALAKIGNDHHIDMLITDVNMPGISGNLLADRAKQMRPHLKIILLSGAESDPHGWPLLRKPFLQSDLTRMIANVGRVCITHRSRCCGIRTMSLIVAAISMSATLRALHRRHCADIRLCHSRGKSPHTCRGPGSAARSRRPW
jgi:CheY-like chemotaxis protein